MINRETILKTAAFLETFPGQYDFMGSTIPHACGSTGCVLGWMHFYSGIEGRGREIGLNLINPRRLVGMSDGTFYSHLTRLQEPLERDWHTNADVAAKCLRRFADEFAPAPITEPIEVREMVYA